MSMNENENENQAFLARFATELAHYKHAPTPSKLANLHQLLADHPTRLPSYHLRKCTDQLSSVSSDLSPTPNKTKFAFNRQTVAVKSPTTTTTTTIPASSSAVTHLTNPTGSIQKPCLLRPPASQTTTALTIGPLTHSIIDLRNLTSLVTLTLSNLSNCLLIASQPLSHSLFVRHCFRSVLLISAAQVRLSDSRHIQLWTRTATVPVIERCESIIFRDPSDHQSLNSVDCVLDFDRPYINDQVTNWKTEGGPKKEEVMKILQAIENYTVEGELGDEMVKILEKCFLGR
ncbi:hypothetical protein CROQUDRAFT_98662 [Cronartium quercuum f. sp. fusiforme G11]|uniref:C-CAP/cofactor C-like domain-containing protein n=1 Tax=Cronartium quercuum f. sp. fusiforme G11 TaxID=708437 RepID=A0A9P6NC73_9BASI|nr:hypothetical protein CROQUDRAFT_98662 [Cronartium quercuum f. sp. fusiforme G11]